MIAQLARIAIATIALQCVGAPAAEPLSDTAKEQRWADQIVDALIDGRAEWLEADGHKFLGIYTEQSAKEPRGGAILLHGIGVHPDWPQVISPLRVGLPEYGWSTLSLQMPVLANDAPVADYVPLLAEVAPRIDAGIDFLRKQGVEHVVLIGHSLGAAMGAYYLANHPNSPVEAFVGIGMEASEDHPELDTGTYLAKIKLPVYDLYGSRDLPQVLSSAKGRALAARKAGNEHYTQIEIEGANHFFDGLNDELLSRVRGWLQRNRGG